MKTEIKDEIIRALGDYDNNYDGALFFTPDFVELNMVPLKTEDVEIIVIGAGAIGPERRIIVLGKDGIIENPETIAKLRQELEEMKLLQEPPTAPILMGSELLLTPQDFAGLYVNDRHKKKGHERPYKFHK